MPLYPQPPLQISFEMTPNGISVSLPQIGISALADSEEEATEALTQEARRFLKDYLSNPLYFFEIPGGSAALPYVFGMIDAERVDELHEYLTGESLPGLY
jgi:hypothetical protein